MTGFLGLSRAPSRSPSRLPTRTPDAGGGGGLPNLPGTGVIIYGQSNAQGLYNQTGGSPPAAASGTSWFDGTSWGAVPNIMGIRRLLNAIAAATGQPVWALGAAQAGESISQLSKGDASGSFTALAAQIAAAKRYFHFIVWDQGEGDAAQGTSLVTYRSLLDALHGDIAALVPGATKTSLPLIIGGLGTTTTTAGVTTDATWSTVEQALLSAQAQLSGAYTSHSQMDFSRIDEYHFDVTGRGLQGDRYGQTINWRLGKASAPANFALDTANASGVDATHTRLKIIHQGGTDFTPTSGITGFEISQDNGANWVTPSGAARIDATTIELTHSSLNMTSRIVRYQYGMLPNVSGAVKDNSTNTVPLLPTIGNITVIDATVFTYITRGSTAGSGATQTLGSIDLGSATLAADTLVSLIGMMTSFQSVSSITFTPNGGSPITATVIKQSSAGFTVGGWIAKVLVPAGTTGCNNGTLTVNYGGNPFGATDIAIETVPAGRLSSTTPTDSNFATASSTIATVNISTTSPGLWSTAALSITTLGTTVAWTGTDTGINQRSVADSNGARVTVADAAGVATHAGNDTITCTFGASGSNIMLAVSYR